MVEQVRVEIASPAAWREVRDLRLAALAEAPDAFASTLRDEHERPDAYWRGRLAQLEQTTFVATLAVDGRPRPVGLAVLGPSFDGGEDILGLYAVWVAPVARGRQVGDALLRAAVDQAATLGARRIVLDVGDHNAPAIALYERWGFSPTGRTFTLPPPRAHVTEHERALDLAGG